MRAGKLRSKINLLRFEKVTDEAGGITGEWVVYAKNVRCDDRVISTQDKLQSNIDLSSEVHTIEIRWRNDIKGDHRIGLQDGRTLKIQGYPRPGMDQKKRSMIITAVYNGD